jgi:AAA ATPase-like protein
MRSMLAVNGSGVVGRNDEIMGAPWGRQRSTGRRSSRFSVRRGSLAAMDTALVERDAAIAAVRAALDAAASGRGRTLFVLGEAGLGKTSILRHAIDIAGPGFHVGSGRGDVVESVLPFGLAAQAIGDRAAADRARRPALVRS